MKQHESEGPIKAELRRLGVTQLDGASGSGVSPTTVALTCRGIQREIPPALLVWFNQFQGTETLAERYKAWRLTLPAAIRLKADRAAEALAIQPGLSDVDDDSVAAVLGPPPAPGNGSAKAR